MAEVDKSLSPEQDARFLALQKAATLIKGSPLGKVDYLDLISTAEWILDGTLAFATVEPFVGEVEGEVDETRVEPAEPREVLKALSDLAVARGWFMVTWNQGVDRVAVTLMQGEPSSALRVVDPSD